MSEEKKNEGINQLSEEEFKEFLQRVQLNATQKNIVGDLLIAVSVLENLQIIVTAMDNINDTIEPAETHGHDSIQRLGMADLYKSTHGDFEKVAKRYNHLIQALMDTLSGEAENNVKNGKFKIYTKEEDAQKRQGENGDDYVTI